MRIRLIVVTVLLVAMVLFALANWPTQGGPAPQGQPASQGQPVPTEVDQAFRSDEDCAVTSDAERVLAAATKLASPRVTIDNPDMTVEEAANSLTKQLKNHYLAVDVDFVDEHSLANEKVGLVLQDEPFWSAMAKIAAAKKVSLCKYNPDGTTTGIRLTRRDMLHSAYTVVGPLLIGVVERPRVFDENGPIRAQTIGVGPSPLELQLLYNGDRAKTVLPPAVRLVMPDGTRTKWRECEEGHWMVRSGDVLTYKFAPAELKQASTLECSTALRVVTESVSIELPMKSDARVEKAGLRARVTEVAVDADGETSCVYEVVWDFGLDEKVTEELKPLLGFRTREEMASENTMMRAARFFRKNKLLHYTVVCQWVVDAGGAPRHNISSSHGSAPGTGIMGDVDLKLNGNGVLHLELGREEFVVFKTTLPYQAAVSPSKTPVGP